MADGNERRRTPRKPEESRRGTRSTDRRRSEGLQGTRQEAERPANGASAARAAIDDLLLKQLPNSASEASEGLAKHLMGTTIIRLRDVRREFLFEWKESGPSVLEVSGRDAHARNTSFRVGASGDVAADASERPEGTEKEGRGDDVCIITTDAVHMLSIAAGHLNPQIAMLSEKIEVSGRVGPALYFFNLIA